MILWLKWTRPEVARFSWPKKTWLKRSKIQLLPCHRCFKSQVQRSHRHHHHHAVWAYLGSNTLFIIKIALSSIYKQVVSENIFLSYFQPHLHSPNTSSAQHRAGWQSEVIPPPPPEMTVVKGKAGAWIQHSNDEMKRKINIPNKNH